VPEILLVDDDPGIRALVAEFLTRHGYAVTVAADGAAMDRALARPGRNFDLIVLDLMMPGEPGLSIARRLAGPDAPAIIILSAMGDDSDRIVGLEMGADDYLAKPCNPRELLARIRAVLRRRAASVPAAAGRVAQFDGWHLDLLRRRLMSPDAALMSLSESEFLLLQAFVEQPQQVLTRDQLLQHMHGTAPGSAAGQPGQDRTIDVQISRLRRKLGAAGDGAELIRTVRNEGYLFVPDVVWR